MTSLAFLATAAIAARLAAAAAPAAPAGEVQIEAGSVVYDATAGRYQLDGGVVLRRGAVVLRSRTARLDPETGEVDAAGDVLLTDATRAVSADGVHALLGGPFEAQNVVAFLKDRAVDLSTAATREGARATGRNRLSFSGETLRGDSAGRLQLEGARLTLCDCPRGAAPSWEIHARHADVVPGERAILSWPVLHVTPRFLFVDRPIPVLILPWLYVPLGERQTGLLLPEILSTDATGFSIAEPIFFTLGRSWDLTLTPAYAFGRSGGNAASGNVRGPMVRAEVRWAPAVGTEGRAELTWLHDSAAEPNGASGNRYSLLLHHVGRLDEASSLRADLGLYGDPVLPRDFTSDILARSATYRRSDLLLDRRADALVLEGGAQYLEPLLPGGIPPTERFGTFGRDEDVLHRWPFASALLLPLGAGPLRLEARAGLARFAPAASLGGGPPTAPQGFAPLDHPAGVDVALRPPVTRADLRAEIAAPLVIADALALEPFLRGAALGYAFDRSGDPATRAWAVAGARLSTEIGRAFGALRHRIVPSLEWRLGSGATGAPLAAAYDPLDRARTAAAVDATGTPLPLPILSAAPEGRFHQLRAAVRNRLTRGGADVLDLEVGQDLDLERGRAGETFFSGALRAGPLALDGYGRALALASRGEPVPLPVLPTGPVARSPVLDRFTELRASAAVADRRGDALRVGLLAVGAGASGALVGGLDPLFELRPAPTDALAQGSAGARAVFGAATLGYDILFPGRPSDLSRCGDPTRSVGAFHVQQHVGTFVWDSPCHCFRVAAMVSYNDCGALSGRATFEIGGLGGRAPAGP